MNRFRSSLALYAAAPFHAQNVADQNDDGVPAVTTATTLPKRPVATAYRDTAPAQTQGARETARRRRQMERSKI